MPWDLWPQVVTRLVVDRQPPGDGSRTAPLRHLGTNFASSAESTSGDLGQVVVCRDLIFQVSPHDMLSQVTVSDRSSRQSEWAGLVAGCLAAGVL